MNSERTQTNIHSMGYGEEAQMQLRGVKKKGGEEEKAKRIL